MATTSTAPSYTPVPASDAPGALATVQAWAAANQNTAMAVAFGVGVFLGVLARR